jgi:hypothetical protein
VSTGRALFHRISAVYLAPSKGNARHDAFAGRYFNDYPEAGFYTALFGILERFYGTDDIDFTFTSDELNGMTVDNQGIVRTLSPRTFPSLSAAAIENARSRIYLGIHWQFDADRGVESGYAIADDVFDNVLQSFHIKEEEWWKWHHHHDTHR